MIAQVISTICHVALCFAFVHGLDMGIKGLAIATSVKDFVLFLSIKTYMFCSTEIQMYTEPVF